MIDEIKMFSVCVEKSSEMTATLTLTLNACTCLCAFRTTLLIERLLHYYNRQEPPMKGRFSNLPQPIEYRLL